MSTEETALDPRDWVPIITGRVADLERELGFPVKDGYLTAIAPTGEPFELVSMQGPTATHAWNAFRSHVVDRAKDARLEATLYWRTRPEMLGQGGQYRVRARWLISAGPPLEGFKEKPRMSERLMGPVTVGRVVMVRLRQAGQPRLYNNKDVHPAVVTDVFPASYGGGFINCRVFVDGEDNPLWEISIPSEDTVVPGGYDGSTWQWPARVEGPMRDKG